MHPLLLEILPQIHKGYCCSQLLMQIFLQSAGEDLNKHHHLLRSMHGLCMGMGGQEGPCGLLVSGATILSLLAGRGAEEERPHPALMSMVQEYQAWFYKHTQSSGHCHELLAAFQAEKQEKTPNIGAGHSSCGELLAACWDEICTIAESYQLELAVRP